MQIENLRTIPTDQELAQAVREAVLALNARVRTAEAAGLTCVQEFVRDSERATAFINGVRITKTL